MLRQVWFCGNSDGKNLCHGKSESLKILFPVVGWEVETSLNFWSLPQKVWKSYFQLSVEKFRINLFLWKSLNFSRDGKFCEKFRINLFLQKSLIFFVRGKQLQSFDSVEIRMERICAAESLKSIPNRRPRNLVRINLFLWKSLNSRVMESLRKVQFEIQILERIYTAESLKLVSDFWLRSFCDEVGLKFFAWQKVRAIESLFLWKKVDKFWFSNLRFGKNLFREKFEIYFQLSAEKFLRQNSLWRDLNKFVKFEFCARQKVCSRRKFGKKFRLEFVFFCARESILRQESLLRVPNKFVKFRFFVRRKVCSCGKVCDKFQINLFLQKSLNFLCEGEFASVEKVNKVLIFKFRFGNNLYRRKLKFLSSCRPRNLVRRKSLWKVPNKFVSAEKFEFSRDGKFASAEKFATSSK